MGNFYQIFTVLAENEDISLNKNILETGVLNIIGLVIILIIYALPDIIQQIKERNNTLETEVKNAKDNYKNAKKKLYDAERQLNQIHVAINEIKEQTIATKESLIEANVNEIKEVMKTSAERKWIGFNVEQNQVLSEFKQLITQLIFERAITQTQELFKTKNMVRQFVTYTINLTLRQIEGDFDD